MNHRHTRRNPLSTMALTALVLCPSGAVAVHSCYVHAFQTTCCETIKLLCDEGLWFCDQTAANGGPFTVNIVSGAGPNQSGKSNVSSTLIGSCEFTPSTCGPTPGSCLPGTPVTMTCHSYTPTGDNCTGR
ncbi:MAG: hypothetical protein JNK25_14960 [Phycisphaerae bacterium]|nr:hypothetical protein [Phycisphaerae bacterium]